MKKRRKIMRLVDWIICVFTKNEAVTQDRTPRSSKRVRSASEREKESERDTFIRYMLSVLFLRSVNKSRASAMCHTSCRCLLHLMFSFLIGCNNNKSSTQSDGN